MILAGGAVDIRLGDWRDVLDEHAVQVDALICDPPYSERTHDGHNDGEEQVRSATGQATRMALAYKAWTPWHVHEFAHRILPCVRGWAFVMTDDLLSSTYRTAYENAERYDFAPVTIIQKRPRLVGDGPASWTVYGMAARPKTTEFSRWGCLPGAYFSRTDRTGIVAGAKPLELMCSIIRDYTKHGDLVLDPFCGGGTTALACAMTGRRCLTCEIDPETYEKACARMMRGHQPDMFAT